MEAPKIEAQEEVLLGTKNNDNNNTSLVIKGKRTKRQRPQSPLPLAIIPYGDHGSVGNNIDQYGSNIIGFTSNNNNNQNTNLNPITCIEFQESTEEEEDMANCLILLAQGQFRPGISSKRSNPDEDAGVNKYNSRRLFQTSAAGGTGKAGYYVYECRTCNRTFPSFQALGGHRASHKKPKAVADEKKNHNNHFIGLLSSDEDYDQGTSPLKTNNHNVSSALSLQLSHRSNNDTNNNNNNHKPKVHECSICGAEFTSGQALGGHMRRHRTPIGNNTNTSLSLTPTIAMETNHQQQSEKPKKAKNVPSLDLDLNLPAPEDDSRDSKFSFVSSKQQQKQQQQQQSSLVFSAPALVDCHY